MPWTVPTPTCIHPAATLTWRQQPYLGETVCGDALFVETDRKDGALQILLLDVSGHGPPAALTADFVGASLRQSVFENHGPAELLTLLHGRLQPQWTATRRHVEAVAVHVDASAGSLSGCRAGGLRDLWLGRPGGGAWLVHAVEGHMFLGMPHDFPYAENHRPLPDGPWLLAVTDGVTEAGKPSPLFGPSLPAFLAALPSTLLPADLLDRLWRSVQRHVGAAWPDDDVTALVLHRDQKNDFPAGIPTAPPENSPHDERDTP